MTTLTIVFIIAVTLVILAYDVYALYRSKKTEYTISYIIAKASLKNPIIPFVFGVLMGHWFWGQCINVL
jgi:hypothetical protein